MIKIKSALLTIAFLSACSLPAFSMFGEYDDPSSVQTNLTATSQKKGVDESQKKTNIPEIKFSEEFETFNMSRYNSLQTADDADALLKQTSFSDFLEEARELASEYKFDSFFGVRLLHNHTYLTEDLVMVESTQIEEDNILFITRPFELKEPTESNVVPASWIPAEHGYTVFEYSSDPEIVDYYKQVKKTPVFLARFHSLISKYGLQNLISPAIVGKSKLVETNNNMGFIEKTSDTPFQSVISLRDISKYEPSKLIQTLWSLHVSPKQVGCVNRCVSAVMCKSANGRHNRIQGHNSRHIPYK